ncbi:hypothetical protein M798_04015 [Brucella melitensis ADMAS-G1]|nr:hypothetical protein M798_04015 [Brucella melitensis ADMAS-G1]
MQGLEAFPQTVLHFLQEMLFLRKPDGIPAGVR